MKEGKIVLTEEWDKVFPKDGKIIKHFKINVVVELLCGFIFYYYL